MGGGGGGSSTSYEKAPEPKVYKPVAPHRTAAPAMPDVVGEQPVIYTGVTETAQDRKLKARGPMESLVIPLEGNTQSGGVAPVRKPTGVV